MVRVLQEVSGFQCEGDLMTEKLSSYKDANFYKRINKLSGKFFYEPNHDIKEERTLGDYILLDDLMNDYDDDFALRHYRSEYLVKGLIVDDVLYVSDDVKDLHYHVSAIWNGTLSSFGGMVRKSGRISAYKLIPKLSERLSSKIRRE